MKANPGKYHLLLSSNDSNKITIGNKTISSSKCEKLLGITIDNNLDFKECIESLCKKASQKSLILCLDLHHQQILYRGDL